jgi:hypothetical protein
VAGTDCDDTILLIKTDANGNKIWGKTFERWCSCFSPGDYYSLQLTSDGGYIIIGLLVGFIKTDADGNQIWKKTFVDGIDVAQQTSDGGYILAGTDCHDNMLLIKTDADGNQVWEKTIELEAEVCPFVALRQTSDGGFIMAGRGGGDAHLIKTDANGNKVWEKAWGGDLPEDVQQTSDGGYIMTGWIREYGAWLIKTNADGNAPAIPSP